MPLTYPTCISRSKFFRKVNDILEIAEVQYRPVDIDKELKVLLDNGIAKQYKKSDFYRFPISEIIPVANRVLKNCHE